MVERVSESNKEAISTANECAKDTSRMAHLDCEVKKDLAENEVLSCLSNDSEKDSQQYRKMMNCKRLCKLMHWEGHKKREHTAETEMGWTEIQKLVIWMRSARMTTQLERNAMDVSCPIEDVWSWYFITVFRRIAQSRTMLSISSLCYLCHICKSLLALCSWCWNCFEENTKRREMPSTAQSNQLTVRAAILYSGWNNGH